MTTFDNREKAFENKYAHDAEMQFKAEARRNKLLGLWAAELFGISGDDADAYAKTVVVADLKEAGDDDVFQKVMADFEARGVAITGQDLRAQMDALLVEAKHQVMTEAGD